MDKQKERKIFTLLRDMGISPSLKGYEYLKFAIEVTMTDRTLVHSIVKKLYPCIADYFGTKPQNVERDIRQAIKVAWSKGMNESQEQLFGNIINPSKGRPTNAEFIGTAVEFLILDEE
jgi:two-component system response regulator (stage 0 sporulation protein A)